MLVKLYGRKVIDSHEYYLTRRVDHPIAVRSRIKGIMVNKALTFIDGQIEEILIPFGPKTITYHKIETGNKGVIKLNVRVP